MKKLLISAWHMNKRLLIALILLTVFCGEGTAHAATEGITLEDGTGYVLMEDGGFILLEEAAASSPTSGINPALLFIILEE